MPTRKQLKQVQVDDLNIGDTVFIRTKLDSFAPLEYCGYERIGIRTEQPRCLVFLHNGRFLEIPCNRVQWIGMIQQAVSTNDISNI